MAERVGLSLLLIIPHLLYLIANWIYGILLIFLLGPFLYVSVILRTFPTPPLLEFATWWMRILSSWDSFLMTAIMAFPLGILLAEGIPRSLLGLGSKVLIDKLKGGDNIYDHFRFRYRLQGDMQAARVWEWELFVYSIAERIQATLGLFACALSISYFGWIVNGILVHIPAPPVTPIVTFTVVLSWLLFLGAYRWRSYRWFIFSSAHNAIWDLLMKDDVVR